MDEAICCTSCQAVGLKHYMRSGSVRTGLLLLAVFVVPGVLYFAWYLLAGHWGCATCGSRAVVPLEIPPEQCAIGVQPPLLVESYQLKRKFPLGEPGQLNRGVGSSLLAG
ncbi:MAG TPA: hypothetical protein VMV57_05705 [Terracidiphilus sp.]|nr:hypothetical protein [Terracidiphilus sp.]